MNPSDTTMADTVTATAGIAPALVTANILILTLALFNYIFSWWEELTIRLALATYAGGMATICFIWFMAALLPSPQYPSFSIATPAVLAVLNLIGYIAVRFIEGRRPEE